MSDLKSSEEAAGSGLRQWGTNWFFKQDGAKTSLNPNALKWAGCTAVVVLSVIQFTEPGASTPARSSHAESIPVPASASVPSEHVFPAAQERSEPRVVKAVGKNVPPSKLAGPQLIARPRNLGAIPPGAMVKARLVSGASNGPAKARLEEALVVNGDMILESGASIIGQGSSTEERLMLNFSQVIFRDGTYGNIQAVACDGSDRIVGLKGSRVGTKALNIAGSIGLGLVGGLSEGLQDTQGQQGATVRPPTMRNALLHATATTALEQSRNLMSDLKERKPIIEVPAGTHIVVLFGGAP